MATRNVTRYQRPWIIAFITPAMILTVIFTLVPAFTLLSYSLYGWESFKRGDFVGFTNFERLSNFPFRGDFVGAFRNNVIVFVTLFLVQTSVGMILALAIYRLRRGKKLFQAIVFLPVILSLVIVAFMWKLFLDPLFGPISSLALQFNLPWLNQPWLGQPGLALFTLIFIGLWRWVGFPAIVFLAGMNSINEEYIEAARIDGASEMQIFRKIIFPLLAPSFTIVAILTFIGAFEWFELPYVIGGVTGQPGGSTTTMALLFYRLAFGTVDSATVDVGLSSAIGVILFIFVGIGAALGSSYLRKREIQQ
ncbi:MAG: carbohydrate ABC transporter permease [Actinomycetota bacterium]